LLTHIHLDHAGAAGRLARENPAISVYVHPVGAPHMIDPSKLVASATRIYGDQMDPLWGEVVPIPEAQVRPLADGETLHVAGRELQVLFTPGHASHHVVFWDAESGAAFTGDVGGVRMPGTGYNCPPTPPPDLDLAAWAHSVARLRELGARRWYLTHFGPFDDAAAHLEQLPPNLDALAEIGMAALDRGAGHEELTALIHSHMEERLGAVPEGILTNLEWATPSYMAALGLIRLHKKRAQAGAAAG
jgi:glyoxylase-like metal-dependent hydrolase (beta-lactamase superfamily II)